MVLLLSTNIQLYDDRSMTWSLKVNIAVAGTLRLLLICYGRIHDTIFQVSFTDIDYIVFTDAARYVVDGHSPYNRSTYRYSPIIAWILTPTISLNAFEFGKLLFTLFDLVSAVLVYSIVRRDAKDEETARISACLVLYNPLTAVVSARGNAESILSILVLLIVYFVNSRSNWILASIFHGLAIHLKLYPVIYLPSVYLHLAAFSPNLDSKTNIRKLITNYRGIIYGLICLVVLAAFTFVIYTIYGPTFLQESLFYHISRRDIRHNFSPYFYPLYLTEHNPSWRWIGSVAFIPQLFLVLLFSWRYSNDLPFNWFISTFAFVAFNKVSTSQYFAWYLTLLSLVWYKIRMGRRRAAMMIGGWIGAQAIWLALAYLLEFKGCNVFVLVWLASVYFLVVNCWVLVQCVNSYDGTKWRIDRGKDE